MSNKIKLISMVALYGAQHDRYVKGEITAVELARICFKYVVFLLRKLKLWMFVPCDKDGNVLDYPKGYSEWLDDNMNAHHRGVDEFRQYDQAQERVLFEHNMNEKYCKELTELPEGFNTIEGLILRDESYTLTKSAQKEIGL